MKTSNAMRILYISWKDIQIHLDKNIQNLGSNIQDSVATFFWETRLFFFIKFGMLKIYSATNLLPPSKIFVCLQLLKHLAAKLGNGIMLFCCCLFRILLPWAAVISNTFISGEPILFSIQTKHRFASAIDMRKFDQYGKKLSR